MPPRRALLLAALPFVLLARSSAAQVALQTRVHATGFTSPVAFVQDPTDRNVQFVVEQAGRIRVVQNGSVLPSDFLDLQSAVDSGGERGLLGMAFAPDYATSGRFFVNFTDTSGNTVVARFKRSANPLVADPSSRFDLRWGGASGPAFIAQPFVNHKGGHLAFGPDGYLYIGLGDGGSGGDPGNRAQTPSELLGKMLRIDVNVPDTHPSGYVVPASNPFVSSGPAGTRPEIWSFGLRNPWRYNFDDPARGGSGALLIADVGQDLWEEIDYEPPNRGGRNYGWSIREGAHDYDTSKAAAFLPLTEPIYEYDHSVGQAIIGGYVYRGTNLGSTYQGRYFFADFIKGRVWSIGLVIDPSGEARASGLIEHTAQLGGTALGTISSFGLDADGELYIVGYSTGKIFKVIRLGRFRDGDFDGDGRADITVYRPSTAGWWILRSATSYTTDSVYGWGLSGDIPVPGDYDGDGKSEVAIYRPSTATWWILWSGSNYTTYSTFGWGLGGDTPVPGDYDGDGKTDIAIYRPSTAEWWILRSSSNYATYSVYSWGLGGDIPVPADYDGDGKADIAIYRPSTAGWWILWSKTNYTTYSTYAWGLTDDVPVPGDYDGDGKADIAIYRPSTAGWWILLSTSNYSTYSVYGWGLGGDTPVPADYDGDGRIDLAIYRPSTSVWWILWSSTNYATYGTFGWGLGGDVPLPRHP